MKHVLHKIKRALGLGKEECEACWPAEKKAAAKPAARKAAAKKPAKKKKR